MASEYTLIAALDTLQPGQEVRFPVHLKILPWFRTDACTAEVRARLQDAASNCGQFQIVGEGEAWLSANSDHRVRYIGEKAVLLGVHMELSQALPALGGEFVKPQYTGEAYRPHISPQLSGRRWVRRGELLLVEGLDLVAREGERYVSEHHIDLRAAS